MNVHEETVYTHKFRMEDNLFLLNIYKGASVSNLILLY
jgi:hypothetical protein